MGCYIARMLPNTSPARQRAATSRARERRSFGRLRRRDSGRWEAAYVGPDARLYRAPSTFEAKDDAIAWLSAERRMIELDTWVRPDDRASRKPTKGRAFGDYAEEWLANRRTKAGPLKPRTQADYRRLLDRHILPTFADRPLRLIGFDEVNAWYLSLNSRTPTERAHAYQLLRAVFTSATKAKLIAENPCAIEGGGQTERAHTVEIATLDELATITTAMPERLRLAVLLGAWCALRYGEIAELRRMDVDLRNGRVRVQRGVTWPNGKATVGTPKTKAGGRVVNIPPHLLGVVKAHLDEHVAPGRNALLFPARDGESNLHPRTFGKRWDVARTAAGRSDLHFHDLRHTGATMAAQTGATIAELMARLGHTTPQAAMRYQSAAADRDKEIARRLSELATGAVRV